MFVNHYDKQYIYIGADFYLEIKYETRERCLFL